MFHNDTLTTGYPIGEFRLALSITSLKCNFLQMGSKARWKTDPKAFRRKCRKILKILEVNDFLIQT